MPGSRDAESGQSGEFHVGQTWTGKASYYGVGDKFQGQETASGEPLNFEDKTAAHQALPFGTMVRVTNLSNGRDCLVRINDRGPFKRGRIIDLSPGAARELQMLGTGVTKVKVEIVSLGKP